jgi:hypothetical protein
MMRFTFQCMLVWLFITAFCLSVHAQNASFAPLNVGSGVGQIGLSMNPNEECRGPATITPAGGGRLAILDSVNRKIVLIGKDNPTDVPLPGDLIEPIDLLATALGYIVVGALGDMVLLDGKGNVISQAKAPHDPETGTIRIVPLRSGGVAIEELNGTRMSVNLGRVVELIIPELAAAGEYRVTRVKPSK